LHVLSVVGETQRLDGVIVLLVENDKELLSAMTQMLEDHGGEVLSAQSAADALTLLQVIDLAPDFLLFDYQLGAGATGIDLWRDIAELHGAIPGVVVSADRSVTLTRLCKDVGAPLLHKPVAKEDLFAAMEQIWQSHR